MNWPSHATIRSSLIPTSWNSADFEDVLKQEIGQLGCRISCPCSRRCAHDRRCAGRPVPGDGDQRRRGAWASSRPGWACSSPASPRAAVAPTTPTPAEPQNEYRRDALQHRQDDGGELRSRWSPV
ncbi:MAG: hypothetical protein MZW92_50235 [Comamonadaceae bacterium]|nr:hypothetical protein [Comamonadaceae bacterium]